MSQRRAKGPLQRADFKIPGISITHEDGRPIENPTPFHYRMAILQLLEDTGSAVEKVTIDGHLCAFVHANPNEVSDAECSAYYDHLVELLKITIEAVKEGRESVKDITSKGGDA